MNVVAFVTVTAWKRVSGIKEFRVYNYMQNSVNVVTWLLIGNSSACITVYNSVNVVTWLSVGNSSERIPVNTSVYVVIWLRIEKKVPRV